jgi:PIN like domain
LKRRSTTSKQPDPIFFLDRNLGKEKLSALLREANFTVKVHDPFFSPTEGDPVWLLWCGQEGYVVLSPDGRIRGELKSLEAILAGCTRVFLLSTSSIKSEMWATALIACRAKLLRLIKKTPCPFISRITSEGRIWGTEQVTREMVNERAVRAYEKRGRKAIS